MQIVTRREKNPLLRAFAPKGEAAVQSTATAHIDAAINRIKMPALAAVRGVDREKFQLRRRSVEHAVDDQRVALDLAVLLRIPGVKHPRWHEPRHILAINLTQRGVVRSAR